jgi:xanthine dehydrogenase YagT iron-sulfur-binding subunit
MSNFESSGPGLPPLSRRYFLKTLGTTAVASAATQVESVAAELQKVNAETIVGPAAVPIILQVNGQAISMQVEPRVTLLDALRNHARLTGAKEVCDRGTCGACTVLLDGKPIYACMMLALEAQGRTITTVEGLAPDGQLSPLQQAFIDSDAMMCGYCTPGFLLSITALLKRSPHPGADEVRHACAGNLCRCGTHPRIIQAALKTAGVATASQTQVIRYADLA